MKVARLVSVLLPVLILSGCGGGSPGDLGRFGVALLDGMQDSYGQQSQALETSDAAYDLGAIRASNDYYFLLSNVGMSAITEITIEPSNSAFNVTPETIDILDPQPGLGILPIIRVGVGHGTPSDGVGLAELLPVGTNEANVVFSGTSEGEGVSLNMHLTLDAKVMDIELMNGSVVVDLTGAYGGTSTNLGGLGFARLYFGVTDPKIKNIGNVDIDVTYYDDETPLGSTTLSPNATSDVTVAAGSSSIIIRLCSNTVTDMERLQLGNDGCAYLAVTDN